MLSALITGTTSGLGNVIAEYLLKQGWCICGFARGESAINHPAYTHYKVDIRDAKGVDAIIRTLPKINMLVNNAAIFSNRQIIETSTEIIDDIIDINVKGTIYVTKSCINNMAPDGKIIFINSVAGLTEIKNQAIYCASKYAIAAFAGVLGEELRPNIHVSSIHPGGINTPLWNNQNPYTDGNTCDLISPDEIAKLVEFIYLQKSEYKTIKMFPSIEWH